MQCNFVKVLSSDVGAEDQSHLLGIFLAQNLVNGFATLCVIYPVRI